MKKLLLYSVVPFAIVLVAVYLFIPNVNAQTVPISCHIFTVGLHLGDNGPEVEALQKFLIDKGYKITDLSLNNSKGNGGGYFGQGTVKSLKKYQSGVGLSATGLLDSSTMTLINSECRATLKIVSPVEGDHFVIGDSLIISWSPSVPVSAIEIIQNDGYVTFGIYAPKYGDLNPITTGSFTYILRSDLPSGTYHVRITPADGGTRLVSGIFSVSQ